MTDRVSASPYDYGEDGQFTCDPTQRGELQSYLRQRNLPASVAQGIPIVLLFDEGYSTPNRGTTTDSPSTIPRWNAHVELHFTPTYSSWLNQVRAWFSKLQREIIDRSIFTSVEDFKRKILRYIRLTRRPPSHSVEVL